eukprot:3608084-Amphidinium_carterae.2
MHFDTLPCLSVAPLKSIQADFRSQLGKGALGTASTETPFGMVCPEASRKGKGLSDSQNLPHSSTPTNGGDHSNYLSKPLPAQTSGSQT